MEAKLQSHPLGCGSSVGIKAHVVQWVPRQRGARRSQPHACSPLPHHGQVPAGHSAGAPTPAGRDCARAARVSLIDKGTMMSDKLAAAVCEVWPCAPRPAGASELGR